MKPTEERDAALRELDVARREIDRLRRTDRLRAAASIQAIERTQVVENVAVWLATQGDEGVRLAQIVRERDWSSR